MSFQYSMPLGEHMINIVEQNDRYDLRIDNQSFSHLYLAEKTRQAFKSDDPPLSAFVKPVSPSAPPEYLFVLSQQPHHGRRRHEAVECLWIRQQIRPVRIFAGVLTSPIPAGRRGQNQEAGQSEKALQLARSHRLLVQAAEGRPSHCWQPSRGLQAGDLRERQAQEQRSADCGPASSQGSSQAARRVRFDPSRHPSRYTSQRSLARRSLLLGRFHRHRTCSCRYVQGRVTATCRRETRRCSQTALGQPAVGPVRF